MKSLIPARWRNHAPENRANDDRFLSPMMWPLQDIERRFFGDLFPFGEEKPLMPAIELDEDEKELRLTAEMPGLSKDDFKVDISGDRLTIHGEKKTSREEKEKHYHYSECTYGSFNRVVTLPCEVKAEKAEAEYKDGVLKIRLPKTEAARSRQIEVKVC